MNLTFKSRVYLLRLLQYSLVTAVFFASTAGYSQPRKQTNWLKEKKEVEQRWRVGAGIHAGEPTGIHLQLYKLCDICKQSITITKRMSIDASVSQEGTLLSKFMEKRDSTWEKGGLRAGLDFKIYFKTTMNPYFGLGAETGYRTFDGNKNFHTDIVGRFGIEQKLFGLKLSPTSYVNTTLFIEGKFNKCITADFSYFLPSAGLRFHFL